MTLIEINYDMVFPDVFLAVYHDGGGADTFYKTTGGGFRSFNDGRQDPDHKVEELAKQLISNLYSWIIKLPDEFQHEGQEADLV